MSSTKVIKKILSSSKGLSKKTKPTIIKQNIGNDISKKDFKICFQQKMSDQRVRIKGYRTFKNTLKGFETFVNWVELKRVDDIPVSLIIEATGVYYEQLVHYLHDHTDYRISVVLPNQSKAYAKSLNLKTKTDKVDAKMLGQLGIERDLEIWQPASKNMMLLKQLTRERIRLLDDKTANLNRLHALKHSYEPNSSTVERLNSLISSLKANIKIVEKEIRATIQTDEILVEKIKNICSVKGLGLISVATIIAETNGFQQFTSRAQVVCYSGYDVVQKQSGTSINGKTRISKKGNKYIRRAMHFPALVVVKYEPKFKQFYDRIFDRSLIKMKAYTAVQRKLLLLIYALYKNDTVYQTDYDNKFVPNSSNDVKLPQGNEAAH